MWKGLFDGIIVSPIGGRKKIPIPEVHGTDFNASRAQDNPIIVNIQNFEVQGESVEATEIVIEDPGLDIRRAEAVFRFNIADYIRLENAVPPYTIRMIAAEELSNSILSEPWTIDNRFITMDDNGIITYKPKGDFLGNLLILSIEIEDSSRPGDPVAQEVGQLYQPEADENNLEDIDTQDAEQVQEQQEIEIPVQDFDVQLDENGDPLDRPEEVIGDDDSEFFQFQGTNGTCAITSVFITAKTLGYIPENTEYEDFLDDFTSKVQPVYDANNNIVGFEPVPGADPPTYLISIGIGLYTQTINPETGRPLPITNPDTGLPEDIKFSDYEFHEGPTGWATVTWMLDQLEIPHVSGKGLSFVDIVNGLEQDGKFILYVDGNELARKEVITRAQAHSDEAVPGLATDANHAVTLTGIETDDDGNVLFILNNTGRANGAGIRVTPAELFSAFADSNYRYELVGLSEFDTENIERGTAITNTIKKSSAIRPVIDNLSDSERAQMDEDIANELQIGEGNYTAFIHRKIRNPKTFLDFAEDYPDAALNIFNQLQSNLNQGEYNEFYEAYTTWAETQQAEEQRILEEYGVDPDDVDDVKDEILQNENVRPG